MKKLWETEGSELTIHQGFVSGCVTFIFIFLGLGFLSGGAFGLMSALQDGSKMENWIIAIAFGSLGLIFVLAGIALRSPGFDKKIVFDRNAEKTRFFMRSIGDEPFEVPFCEISHIRLMSVHRSSGKSSYTAYPIYAINKDGSQYWIYESADKNQATELVTEIVKHTGLSLHDETGIVGNQSAARTFAEHGLRGNSIATSYVIEDSDMEGNSIRIKKPKSSPVGWLILLIIFAIILSFPTVIIYNMVQSGFEGEMLIPLILIGAVFLLILFFVLASFKETRLFMNGSRLTVQVKFKIWGFLNKSIEYTATDIYYIRVNILQDGACTLTLGVSPTASNLGFLASAEGSYDVSIGIDKSEIYNSFQTALKDKTEGKDISHDFDTIRNKFGMKEMQVSLFSIPGDLIAGRGPNIYDLKYIEHTVENHIRLKEKSIDERYTN